MMPDLRKHHEVELRGFEPGPLAGHSRRTVWSSRIGSVTCRSELLLSLAASGWGRSRLRA